MAYAREVAGYLCAACKLDDNKEAFCMKKLRVFPVVMSLVLLLFSAVTAYAQKFGTSPNIATNDHPDIFTYKGYVQVRPNAIQKGKHAASGYIRYQGGSSGDTGRLYAIGSGYGCSDPSYYKRSKEYKDTLNPIAPKTTFNYGFTWITHETTKPERWP